MKKSELDKLSNEIIKVISGIYDPEIPVNIYELGLIYDVEISDLFDVNITNPI